jgi:hypothetical protein
MLKKLASWLDERGSSRMIRRVNRETGKEHDYLKRFYIFRSKLFSVFIHQFWASDADHIHDHPWSNISWIIRGGYHETSADGTIEYRKKGFKTYRNAEIFHRISIGDHSPGEAWTIFIHFKRKREWGFLTPEGWMPAAEYGAKYESPVETQQQGDFKIVGALFPKVVDLG